MALNTSQLFGAIEPVVRKFYGLQKNKYKPEYAQVFDVSEGKEAVRHSMEFGGPGQMQLKTENGAVSAMTIMQGADLTHTWNVYAGQIVLSWELVRDMKYRAIKTVAGALGRSMALTPEYLGAQFMGRAFSSTYSPTADGKAMCATNHTIVGTNATTGSNTLATPAAYAEASMEDALTQLMTMPGPDGMPVQVNAERLVLPAALSILGDKYARSEKTLGSANNDPSYVKGAFTKAPLTYRYMDSQSTSNWFIKTDYDNGLFWEWDVKEEFMKDNSPTTMQEVYVGFFRCRFGIDDWRGIFGVNPN